MDTVIKIVFALHIFMLTWLYQEQNQAWDVERRLLKGANNLATHDAVQNVTAVGNGQIIVDEQAAYDTFLATLQANLGLDGQLTPSPGSPLPTGIKIVHFEVIDSRTVTFPYLYENSSYRVAKYLRGPAVFAVIETSHPTLLRDAWPQTSIRVPSIFEYAGTE